MRKIIFTLLVALGAVASNAQNGKVFLAGEVGISYTTNGDVNTTSKTTSWTILPTVGVMVSENTGIAAKVGYGQITGVSMTKKSAIVVAPFVRRIFLKGDIGSLFVDGGVDLAFGKQGNVNTTDFGVGLKPGAIINVGNGVALTATFGRLGYQYSETNMNEREYHLNNFSFGLNLDQATLGVMFLF